MRHMTIAALVFVLAVFPLTAYAGCPTIVGPTACCGRYWYYYNFDTSCAGTSGNVSTTNMWCYSTPAHQFGTGTSTVTYSYTIGSSDPVLTTWAAELRYVEWSDPNNSIYNTLVATVSVTHNGSTTSNTFLSINGTTSRSCSLESGGFSATTGDTITVTITTTIYNSNVTAQVGALKISTLS